MEIRITFEQTTAGTSGSGAYLFQVPNSKIIDTTKIEAASGGQFRGFCGSCITTDFTTFTHDGMVVAYDTTNFSLFIPNIGVVGSDIDNLGLAPIRYHAFLTLPILTWSVGGGSSGYSGFSGQSGFSGFSGIGISGFSGYSGVSAALFEYEIDFTSTPQFDKTFIVTADCTVSSIVEVTPSGKTPTGGTGDEGLFDLIGYTAAPSAGFFTLYSIAIPGPVSGKRIIIYKIYG